MGNLLKPDIPGPTQDELDLIKSQKQELKATTLERNKKEAESRKNKRKQISGQVGIRSLLSGNYGGFGQGLGG